MSTVYRRDVRSTPHRDAGATWTAIIELLTRGASHAAKTELEAVTGTVASLIADHAAAQAPIVVTCDGPRTRLYCLHDDDALDESDSNESPLGFDALAGDWAISLPCPADDLGWVQAALKRHSARITARDAASGMSTDAQPAATSASKGLVLDREAFLKS